ncbi:MAG: cysteine desulfurase family protein [Opitutaceae bacterium]
MIYLDYNSTCRPSEAVRDSILPFISTLWGNPSSSYAIGIKAKQALDEARLSVAHFLNASAEQVLFTSGATEAINSAIHSAISRFPERKHIVTSAVEHSATLGYCDYLEKSLGYEVTRLPVDADGGLSIQSIDAALRPDTAIVSLIWANNETGVVWPVSDFAELCHIRGVPIHIDAVQAVGRIAVDFKQSGADFLSLSGHKFGAIKGAGALIISEPDSYVPLIIGGKQERGLRGGTESVPLCVALGEAAKICSSYDESAWVQVAEIRDAFESEIARRIPGARINGKLVARLPNTTSLYLPGIDSDAAVTYLDQKGICVSSGSACLEHAITPSHVIYAMTQSHDIASETLRISLGMDSTQKELAQLTEELVYLIQIYS